MAIYELRSENLTGLGGPMGTERTWENYRLFFSSAKLAKSHAEKEYGKPLEWIKGKDSERTADLGHVMYHVHKVKVTK